MNTIEIMCEACDAKMRLSSSLLRRIKGRSGRITCKQCSSKVGLDASGRGIAVIFGGVLIENGRHLEPAASEDDPHLSESPASGDSESAIAISERRSSIPPPLPVEARAKRRLSVEAPPPPAMRAMEDSLSPHTFEDEASLAALAHDIRSTPYSAPPPRDLTYSSLYPEPKPKSDSPVSTMPYGSRAPTPPRAGELHRSMAPQNPFESGYGIDVPQGRQAVVVTADGQLLNQADIRHISSTVPGLEPNKSSKAPWILAAVALFALGISLSAQVQDGVSMAWGSATGNRQANAALATATRAASVPDVLIEAEAPKRDVDSEQSGELDTETDALSEEDEASTAGDKPSVQSPTKAQLQPRAIASTEMAKAEKAVVPASEMKPDDAPQAGPFSSGAAAASMREATALASACRSATDPTGTARVVVTFSPSGRVTSSTVSGPPFAGTATGGCIASRFRAARVPAFSGEAVTVAKTVTIR